MKKANVAGLERMAAGYLQHMYRIYLMAKRIDDVDESIQWDHYTQACQTLEAFGCEWRRYYSGSPDDQEQLDDIRNYAHNVWFPTDAACERLNFAAWDD